MDAGKPDLAEAPETAPSLLRRLVAGLRAAPMPAMDRRFAVLFGALLAAGPMLTLAGATLLAQHEQDTTVRLQNELAPRLAAEAAAREARTALGSAAGRPAMGTVLEALASALPGDASLARAERTKDGGLELDIAATDPDALRAAIRQAPDFAGMRNTSQRRTDAAMIVSMREDAQ